MKKVFAFIVLFSAMTMAASAQGVKFGVKGGLDLQNMKFNESVFDSENKLGWFIGPTLQISLPIGGLGVDISGLYDQKSTKINGESGGLTTLDTDRLKNMGINTEYYNKIANHDTDVDKFLFSRVFGGNNKADMRIMPKWHLKSGSIENLYSGGNEGRMTSETGILLEIGTGSNINVYNVYGGCRKADVCPETSPGNTVPRVNNITGYSFPDNLPNISGQLQKKAVI